MAAGDDKTDEDLFAILPAHACSVKVGLQATKAKYIIHNPEEFCLLLEEFADVEQQGNASK